MLKTGSISINSCITLSVMCKTQQTEAVCGCRDSQAVWVVECVKEVFVFVCVCACVCLLYTERVVCEGPSECRGRAHGCGSGELSNRSSNVSLTFSSSESLCSLLSLSLSVSLFIYFFPLSVTVFSYFSLHRLSPSLSHSAGREECRRSSSKRQYTDNCFLVTVT